jgi:biopolymer transport protein ExbD
LSVQQKGQGQAGEDTPPEKVFKLVIVVNSEGYNLVADQDQQPIPKKGEQYDVEKLGTELKKLKDSHPDKTDVQIASEDAIKFETLVKTMDTAMTARFPDVSLIDAGGAGI